MKITIQIELEPHELSTTSGCQVTLEAHRTPHANRHKHGVVDEAQLAGDALNGLVNPRPHRSLSCDRAGRHRGRCTHVRGQAARLLREIRENPPGRTGHYWDVNHARLVAALEKARLEVCAYAFHATCDCKRGLVPGPGVDPNVIGSEHTGCPELRDLIRALMEAGPTPAVVPAGQHETEEQ